MRIAFSATFAAGYRALPREVQARADKAIRLLTAKEGGQPFHPSLRAKRVQGTLDIWEASVTMKYRLTFQIHEDTLYLRVIGDHDAALKRP
jgi:mRNA-degrading endonuclease YafQ of YafQ-DinJ toxin-antitoxin module